MPSGSIAGRTESIALHGLVMNSGDVERRFVHAVVEEDSQVMALPLGLEVQGVHLAGYLQKVRRSAESRRRLAKAQNCLFNCVSDVGGKFGEVGFRLRLNYRGVAHP